MPDGGSTASASNTMQHYAVQSQFETFACSSPSDAGFREACSLVISAKPSSCGDAAQQRCSMLDIAVPLCVIIGTQKALTESVMSRGDQANKRTDSLRVRLSPDMMQRFQAIAGNLGMPPSTLAALAIGTYVIEQERIILVERTLTTDGVVVTNRKTPVG